MPYKDVEVFSNAAKGKVNMLREQPGKFFLRTIMAGFFIAVAMIYNNVVGNVFKDSDPAWGKMLGAIVFSIAVLLIVFIGSELFTGNNLVMAFGAYDKAVTWKQVGKVWLVSYIGNFVGCAFFRCSLWLPGPQEQQIISQDMWRTSWHFRWIRCFLRRFCVTSLSVLRLHAGLSARRRPVSF